MTFDMSSAFGASLVPSKVKEKLRRPSTSIVNHVRDSPQRRYHRYTHQLYMDMIGLYWVESVEARTWFTAVALWYHHIY